MRSYARTALTYKQVQFSLVLSIFILLSCITHATLKLSSYLPLIFNCRNHHTTRMSLKLVRTTLHSMIKTCPFNSKTTRIEHKKYIFESTCTTLPVTFGMKNCNNQMPNRPMVIILSSQFWCSDCSQCFTCHATELLLLPTTHNQLCIWHESYCPNTKICAIFPPPGYTCWRWCSNALLQNPFSSINCISTAVSCQFSFLSSKLKPAPVCMCCLFCKLLFQQQVSPLMFLYDRQGC